jgi:hypothetical protein
LGFHDKQESDRAQGAAGFSDFGIAAQASFLPRSRFQSPCPDIAHVGDDIGRLAGRHEDIGPDNHQSGKAKALNSPQRFPLQPRIQQVVATAHKAPRKEEAFRLRLATLIKHLVTKCRPGYEQLT